MWSLIEVNERKEQGGGLGPLVAGEVHLPAEGEAVRQCLLSFCNPVSITHDLGLLLTQLAAPSVYSLHPNMFGILITSLH